MFISTQRVQNCEELGGVRQKKRFFPLHPLLPTCSPPWLFLRFFCSPRDTCLLARLLELPAWKRERKRLLCRLYLFILLFLNQTELTEFNWFNQFWCNQTHQKVWLRQFNCIRLLNQWQNNWGIEVWLVCSLVWYNQLITPGN